LIKKFKGFIAKTSFIKGGKTYNEVRKRGYNDKQWHPGNNVVNVKDG